ncbi:MAG TPA: head GIN domain-containing protein [Flavobacterium sp.]|jgi:hypothetical protein|nr:head GIN domain-containing protein [Flavobacterium sp.]
MNITGRISVKIAAILAVTLMCSCRYEFNNGVKGNGKITTDNREVNGDFSSIEVEGGLEVIVSQGEKSITVETDDNLQRLIETRIENGVLYIGTTEGVDSNETPTVTVKSPILNGLTASAGSTITSTGRIITPKLIVESDSGSTISISVEAENLSLEASGGSSIDARGKAITLETSSSSGSSLDASDLRANDVVAQASSGSSTDVHPLVSLNASASSGSSIDYANRPKSLKKEESSGGSVSQN